MIHSVAYKLGSGDLEIVASLEPDEFAQAFELASDNHPSARSTDFSSNHWSTAS
jgi:hypothetical protein